MEKPISDKLDDIQKSVDEKGEIHLSQMLSMPGEDVDGMLLQGKMALVEKDGKNLSAFKIKQGIVCGISLALSVACVVLQSLFGAKPWAIALFALPIALWALRLVIVLITPMRSDSTNKAGFSSLKYEKDQYSGFYTEKWSLTTFGKAVVTVTWVSEAVCVVLGFLGIFLPIVGDMGMATLSFFGALIGALLSYTVSPLFKYRFLKISYKNYLVEHDLACNTWKRLK